MIAALATACAKTFTEVVPDSKHLRRRSADILEALPRDVGLF